MERGRDLALLWEKTGNWSGRLHTPPSCHLGLRYRMKWHEMARQTNQRWTMAVAAYLENGQGPKLLKVT